MKIISVVLLLFILLMQMEAKPVSIQYRLGMSKPSTHFYEIEMTISNLSKGEKYIEFALPVWRSGRYLVLDFAGGVQEFQAKGSEQATLQWKKTDKTTWRVETKGNTSVTIQYKVYANEFNLRTRGLNDEHGFVDGSALFMYVEKYRMLPITLNVEPFGNWHVTTGLDSVEGKKNEFTAPSYDVLVDCPLEIGNQHDFPFDVDGTPHVLSIAGEGNWNADTMINDMKVIIRKTRDMWGEFPYKRFVFILHCSPSSGGGTEHLNSIAMGARPFIFKNKESYRGYLGLVAHEYFHTWNVKQLRPKGLSPYNFQQENYTEELWISEGTTSYYDNLLLVRCKYQTTQKYLEDIAQAVRSDRQRPGNRVQSIVESSYDAWVKFWRGNQQSYNSETDYYGKGSLVSMFLDLEIRHRSMNKSSLDDVLRALYKKFPLGGTGFTVSDFQKASESAAGSNLDEFFTKYVYGTEPLPWEATMLYAGLELVQKDTVPKPYIGMSLNESNGRTMVSHLPSGSPAYEAGVDIGDEVIALNGYRIRASDLADRIKDLSIGEVVKLTILRNDHLREIEVLLEAGPLVNYQITKIKEPTGVQQSLYEQWFETTWNETKK